MNEHEKPQIDFMHKLARQIVERRNLVFLFVILAAIFTVFSVRWVKVETDMTTYLPKTSETRMGLDIMDEQFTTYGSADVMVANITPAEADELSDRLTELKGVQMLDYDDTTDHYNKDSVSALYSITFDYPEDDDQCLEALDRVKEYLADYDIYVSTSLGNTQQETIDAEVRVIMVYVAVIIVIVLLLTSQTYAEVPVLILTFVVGMILNMGTNFMLGTISFVSNSVTNILQLALSLDYAIIFCNHFKEEHQTMPLKEAVIESLSKSIPEISSSSLTTIGGLVAMLFMQFRIGSDMAICLIKSILFAMLSVFVVMPGLLMLFGPYMDKTKHRNFVPEIPFVGRFAWRTRKVIPVIFLVVILIGHHFSNLCPYAYGYDVIKVPKMNESLIADQMIEENFTKSNLVALVYPKNDDYSIEKKMLEELESYDEIDSTKGLSNIEAEDGYMLEDKLTARQFSEMANLDYEAAQMIYTAYAIENEEYGQVIGNFASSAVPASSHVAEEGVTEPINMLTWTLDDLDREDTVTFIPAEITSGVQNGKLTAKVFSYDLYKKEEIENLAVGDKITLHEEGAAWNQFVTVAVESIEKNDQYHLVTINGGMEEQYGLDLKLEEDGTYRTMTFDDYPVYYEMGEKTLPLADGVVLKDSSADPQAEAVETTGADAVAAAINAGPDNWTVYNTTLVVQGGRVQEVRRIWVP